jgi:tetratricopeptide (TPR) repeat protein
MANNNVVNEDAEQLLRTIEMFEAITLTQPDDYQSLEILKEAYTKLGRHEDSLRVSQKLADTHASLGHISQAILEYEGILQERPNDANALAALTQLQAKISKPRPPKTTEAPPSSEASKPIASVGPESFGVDAPAGAPVSASQRLAQAKAGRTLVEVLLAEKIVTPQALEPLLQRLKTEGPVAAEKGQPLTLVQLLADEQIAKLDDILYVLINRSGLPYLPLSTYEVDQDAALLLPAQLCFAHCIVPFDLISRSLLVAVADPFDTALRDRVQRAVKQNVFWYVSPPAEITAALRRTHRIDPKHTVAPIAQAKS